MAIDVRALGSNVAEPDPIVRVHAYDIIGRHLAHPLFTRYSVEEDLAWADAAPVSRCRHCLQIVAPLQEPR